MNKKCEKILEHLRQTKKLKISNYKFPEKQELKLRIKDLIEEKVDEKYFLSQQAIKGRLKTNYQEYRLKENIIDSKKVHPTILAKFEKAPTLTNAMGCGGYRIRKLTPKECWRLMGFDDEDFEKASMTNSNTQLYKQAGNSIVVDVIYEVIKNLIPVEQG